MLNFGARDNINDQAILEILAYNCNSSALISITVELRNLIANFDHEIDV
jgi:hypothetical protein